MTTAIDLFAGLGGWSTGARAAGVQVLWAANHWPVDAEWESPSGVCSTSWSAGPEPPALPAPPATNNQL